MFTKTFLAVLAFSPLFAHASAIWNVTVGGAAGLVYTPTSVQAEVGDTVHFIFESANHTVTQSTFDAPCSPILGGVNTGFNQAISPDATSGFKTFDIVVQSVRVFLTLYQPCSLTFPTTARSILDPLHAGWPLSRRHGLRHQPPVNGRDIPSCTSGFPARSFCYTRLTFNAHVIYSS